MPPPAEAETDAESSEPEAEEEMEEDDVETEDDGVETEDDGGPEETEDGKGSEEGHSRAGARVSAAAAAAAGDGGVGSERPPNCCCVCMEPWTCNDAHRICCIPCGHVYGRSCLERWLQRCGNMSAKCPQCGERFELKHITNLYAPRNLWDGCCCAKHQEVNTLIARLTAKVAEDINKLKVELTSNLNDMHRKFAAEVLTVLRQDYRDQLDRNVAAMLKEFASMKEQMKKMMEGGASPRELMEFMEQAYTQLPVPKHPAADA